MRVSALVDFVCPLCSQPLRAGKSWVCAQGHSFDQAREGYVNLLPVQRKKSLDPGDNQEMVAARGRFLDAGHFAPIADRVAQLVTAKAAAGTSTRLVDAGCGEGYYLQKIQKAAAHASGDSNLLLGGFDISKWAVRAAAKRAPDLGWAVASNRHPPFAAADGILSLFGFPDWESFARLQSGGGWLLLVDPMPGHLLELRQLIYPEVKTTRLLGIEGAFAAGYELESEEALEFYCRLESAESIQDLLWMTPHGYRVSDFGKENIAKARRLDCSVQVSIRLLRFRGK